MAVVPDSNRISFSSTQRTTFQNRIFLKLFGPGRNARKGVFANPLIKRPYGADSGTVKTYEVRLLASIISHLADYCKCLPDKFRYRDKRAGVSLFAAHLRRVQIFAALRISIAKRACEKAVPMIRRKNNVRRNGRKTVSADISKRRYFKGLPPVKRTERAHTILANKLNISVLRQTFL